MKTTIFAFVLVLLTLKLEGQNQLVYQLKNSAGLKYASIGISVKNLNTGKTITAYHASTALIPASTQKLITTAAALTLLKDTAFATLLQYDGHIEDSVLYGNIYVYGGGDPTLGSENFGKDTFWSAWVDAVKKLGINTIQGNIIADASCFDYYPTPRKWSWEDLGNYYGAPPTGICIYDNTCKIYFKTGEYSGAPTQIIKISPDIPGLKIKNYVKSARIRSDQSYIIGAPFSFDRRAIGRLPYRRDSFVVKGSIPDPPLLTAQIFAEKLKQNKVKITGQALTTRTFDDYTPRSLRKTFYVHTSPHINDIIRLTNRKSINLYAEVLLNHLGLQFYGKGNTQNGIKVLYDFLDSINIPATQVFLTDGSGLSRYNNVTPDAMVKLLEFMYRSSKSREFFSALPVAGKSGTLKYFGKNTPLEGRVFAKSGSMKRIRAYAGYMINNKGNTIAFAVILNNFHCSQSSARKYIEKFLIKLLEYD